MILVIDNYDSFVHNLARYFRLLDCETVVVRNDAISVADVLRMKPEAIVISPGPGTPDDAGCTLEVIGACYPTIPILGVCLGHQAIVQALGGRIVTSHQPMHGRESPVWHDGSELFTGLPSPFGAGRYHSLIAEKKSLPTCLDVTAHTEDGTIMAVKHQQLPVVGVQFHPESILTRDGQLLVRNFLHLCCPHPSVSKI